MKTKTDVRACKFRLDDETWEFRIPTVGGRVKTLTIALDGNVEEFYDEFGMG